MKLIWHRSKNTSYILVAKAVDDSWYGLKVLPYNGGYDVVHVVNGKPVSIGHGWNLADAKLAARTHMISAHKLVKNNPSVGQVAGWSAAGVALVVLGPFIALGVIWGVLAIADEIKYGHTWNG